MTKPFVAIGMICRALILFWAVFGLALFFCDAFRLTTAYPGGAVSTQTLALMAAAAIALFTVLALWRATRLVGLAALAIGLAAAASFLPKGFLADRFRHDMERLYGAARGRRLWCCPMDT